MDREEHLKKAREKLKKFQKKKNQCETTTQGSTSRSTPDLDDEASSNKDGGDNNSKRSTPKNEFIDLSQPEMPLPGPSTQPEEETNSLQSQHYTFESSKAMENDPFKSIVPIPANIDVDESSSVSDQIQSILDNSKKQGLSEIVKDESSSVSDQIQSILDKSKTQEILSELDSDTVNESEILKARLSQLETENQELKNENLILQQKNGQLQNVSDDSNAKLLELQNQYEEEKRMLEEKFQNEAKGVQTKLDSHADSIQILVSEKRDIESSMTNLLKELEEVKDENRCLKEAQQKKNVSSKERTCACTDRVFLAEVERKSLSEKLSQVRDERDQLKIQTIDLKQDILEMKSKIEFSEKNTLVIAQQLVDTKSKLEMTEINLAQLKAANDTKNDESNTVSTTTADDANNSESEKQKQKENNELLQQLKDQEEKLAQSLKDKESEVTRLALENEEHLKRVSELTAYIQQASQDREQIIQQYTSYSQQLAAQIENLTQQLNIKASENHGFAKRETDLVQHVQRLENQLQSFIQNPRNKTDIDSSSSLPVTEVVAATSVLPTQQPIINENELQVLRLKMAELDKCIVELQLEREKLQDSLSQESSKLQETLDKCQRYEQTIGDLQTKIEMSQEFAGSMDITKQESLVAASASDKLAASRAMKQNQQLKDQVEELENAIVQVTNSKAELITNLDASRSKLKKLEESDASMKSQLNGLQEGIKERDRNLTRMREQVKHYLAFAETSAIGVRPEDNNASEVENSIEVIDALKDDLEKISNELKNAKEEIRCLNSHNSELKGQLEVLSSQTRESSLARPSSSPDENGREHYGDDGDLSSVSSNTSVSVEESHHIHCESDKLPVQITSNNGIGAGASSSPISSGSSSSSTSEDLTANSNEDKNFESNGQHHTAKPFSNQPPVISKDVGLLKVEQKFNEAMEKIAVLTSEKEQLEHIIIRLQDETDTVGEYITLYQYQRAQQRARLDEKERQLQTISRDREELKSKLTQLQSLITGWMNTKDSNCKPNILADEKEVEQEKAKNAENDNHSNACIEVGTEAAEVEDELAMTNGYTGTVGQNDTAGRILNLISEIGSNDMLTNEQFHPWFWDSSPGKLINV